MKDWEKVAIGVGTTGVIVGAGYLLTRKPVEDLPPPVLPKATLYGTVTDEAGWGIAETIVKVNSFSATTSATGGYAFYNLNIGSYSIEVSKRGFVPFYDTITLSEGDNELNITLKLPITDFIDQVRQWVYETYPNARELSDGECTALRILKGWIDVSYAPVGDGAWYAIAAPTIISLDCKLAWPSYVGNKAGEFQFSEWTKKEGEYYTWWPPGALYYSSKLCGELSETISKLIDGWIWWYQEHWWGHYVGKTLERWGPSDFLSGWSMEDKAKFMAAVEVASYAPDWAEESTQAVFQPSLSATTRAYARAALYTKVYANPHYCYLFEADNFLGQSWGFDGNVLNFVEIGFNDMASSVLLWSTARAILYAAINYKGNSLLLERSCLSLREFGWNDITSSIRVVPPY